MFTFLLQLRSTVQSGHRVYLFSMFVILVWVLWAVKVVLASRYRPWITPYETSNSVVIPVVDEPLDLFRDVLQRILRQEPGETIVVINGPRNHELEAVADEFAPAVRWIWTPVPGKRNAVRIGVEECHGDIVLLVDSDTLWTEGTLTELLKPFADPRVGGVTTNQRILDPGRCFLTRWADWLESSRVLYAMAAQSVLGQVGCLPGRTIAFRRHILVRSMAKFLSERFLGVFLEVSDDRTLTNYALKEGYRTVFQVTSLVYTDAPTQLNKLRKQQFRWARGSQYNTLRMLPWMLGHAPMLAVFFLADIVLPFLLLGSILGWVRRAVSGDGENVYGGILGTYGHLRGLVFIAGLTVAASTMSMALRQLRHLDLHPADTLRLPLFILFSTVFLMPVRLVGFVRMAHAGGWGTRSNAYTGARDQPVPGGGSASLGTWAMSALPATAGVARGDVALAQVGSAPVAVDGVVRVRPAWTTTPPADVPRRFNPYAAIPYLIAAGLLILGVVYNG